MKNIKDFTLTNISIKNITFLGFALVALPLIMALFYSASQINLLSKKSTHAIFQVAKLNQTNSELVDTLKKMERSASQYLVLNDIELKQNFIKLSHTVPIILAMYQQDKSNEKLMTLSKYFNRLTLSTVQLINQGNTTTLNQLQTKFRELAQLNRQLHQQTNIIIDNKAQDIKLSADIVNFNLLISLIIIPISLLVSIVFIYLITTPLKKLTTQIQSLAHGNFEQTMTVTGSNEISEIANALEIMRTRLHALELQKSSFIRHTSHELKTPLAAIREGIELLHDNSVGPLNQSQQEVCSIIKLSVKRLQQLIEALLDFNIVLDSTSLQDREKMPLSPLIEQVLAQHLLEIKSKKINIDKQLMPIGLYCNGKQLMVILENIISNAIKFSPTHGTMTIKTEIANQQLTLSITDQGIGIAPEIQQSIFDAFYQGLPPQSSKIKGSGLGLTIVKELLMRLNGNITVHSQKTQPSGTTMLITLPRAFLQGEDK